MKNSITQLNKQVHTKPEKTLTAITNNSRGCHWHIFKDQEINCLCGHFNRRNITRNSSQKDFNKKKLIKKLEQNKAPGLGNWATACKRKALKDLTETKPRVRAQNES